MIRTSSRWRLCAAVSPLALALIATPAFAQDATADAAQQAATAAQAANVQAGEATAAAATASTAAQAAAQATSDDQPTGTQPTADANDSIVVTGFRAALRNATATKKRQDQIIEAVNAEDIGKLPDNSIAESIARLPGLAAQRTQGRASIISIRGFGPDFSVTTLNGREQTTTNDSRTVEFDQFPSEVMNQVVVYKSSSADLAPQGLVGTVDLRTVRPLDSGKRVIAVGARGTYVGERLMPDASNKGWRGFATYVDQLANDTIGVALSASYTDEPYQTKDFQAWGFSNYDANTYKPDGIKQWFEASSLKRLGLMGTVQAKVSDSLTMTWDGFYSHFKDFVNQRGIEFQGNNLVGTDSDNGFLTAGTFNGIHPIVEGYANDRDAKLYSVGWNTKYDGHNGWRGMIDLAWSRTDRTDERLESTIGTGYAGAGPATNIDYVWTDHGPEFTLNGPVDFGDPSQLVLTDTQGWGWSRVQAGYDAVRTTRDDIKQARAELEREIGGGFIDSIKAGVTVSNRSKKLNVIEGFLVPGGTGTCPVGDPSVGTANTPCSIAIPQEALVGTIDFMRGIGPIVAYDPRILLDNGTLVFQQNFDNAVLKRPYKVTERVFTPFVMAKINGQVGAGDLTGNVGIQAVHTDQTSEGVAFPNGVATPTKVGIKYWEWLPSLNLALRQPSGLVFRFAAARQMMRARLPDMASNIDYGTNAQQGYIITGSGGNPYIKPYMATAFDFNIEKYFGNSGYISLQTYYKKITRYISRGVIPFDYSDLPPPTGIPPVSDQGTLNTLANTKGGKLYGFELAGTLPFEVLTPALSGFGITGGISYTKTSVRNFAGEKDVIPGYSKWVGNLTAFYENSGFNVRGSMRYRGGFKGEFRDYKGDDSPQFVLAETVFDAQVGYDFPNTSRFGGLSLYLQGQNLTNEPLATVDPKASDNDIAFLRYQTFGRRFVAGATYKFGAEAPLPPPPPPPPPPPVVAPPATQTCSDGTQILATDVCPVPPPPPPPPAPAPERGS
ncbi:MAG TPA: TonB-dependent receptor [Sphingomicrobium sp.]|jgi:iron complex outermembrane receptor protein